jgi:hypothetical protein
MLKVRIYGYLGICGVQFHGSKASKSSTLEACGKRSRARRPVLNFYSLVETAKANGQEPYAWLRHALERLVTSVEDYEALLPWNCSRYYLAKRYPS